MTALWTAPGATAREAEMASTATFGLAFSVPLTVPLLVLWLCQNHDAIGEQRSRASVVAVCPDAVAASGTNADQTADASARVGAEGDRPLCAAVPHGVWRVAVGILQYGAVRWLMADASAAGAAGASASVGSSLEASLTINDVFDEGTYSSAPLIHAALGFVYGIVIAALASGPWAATQVATSLVVSFERRWFHGLQLEAEPAGDNPQLQRRAAAQASRRCQAQRHSEAMTLSTQDPTGHAGGGADDAAAEANVNLTPGTRVAEGQDTGGVWRATATLAGSHEATRAELLAFAQALSSADVLLQNASVFVGIKVAGAQVITFTVVEQAVGLLFSLFVIVSQR